MSKKANIYRFAFGTALEPASSVWRANVLPSGDVYLNNSREHGNQVHISLHASGQFHLKLDSVRHVLKPPFYQENCAIHGPCILFDLQDRNLPPPPASGSLEKINWLGLPTDNHFFCISTFYCSLDQLMCAEAHEKILFGPVKVKLFHEEKLFYMILASIKNKTHNDKHVDEYKNIKFSGSIPAGLELVRVSKTSYGTSAIIIEGFNASME